MRGRTISTFEGKVKGFMLSVIGSLGDEVDYAKEWRQFASEHSTKAGRGKNVEFSDDDGETDMEPEYGRQYSVIDTIRKMVDCLHTQFGKDQQIWLASVINKRGPVLQGPPMAMEDVQRNQENGKSCFLLALCWEGTVGGSGEEGHYFAYFFRLDTQEIAVAIFDSLNPNRSVCEETAKGLLDAYVRKSGLSRRGGSSRALIRAFPRHDHDGEEVVPLRAVPTTEFCPFFLKQMDGTSCGYQNLVSAVLFVAFQLDVLPKHLERVIDGKEIIVSPNGDLISFVRGLCKVGRLPDFSNSPSLVTTFGSGCGGEPLTFSQ